MNDNPSLKTNIIQGSLSDPLYLHPFNTKVSRHPAFTVWFPKIDSIMNVSSTCDIEIKLWCTWALAVTHGACEYTEQKFNAEKTGGDTVIPSPHLDTDLVMACDQLVDCLIKAYKNPSADNPFNHSNSFITVWMEIDIARYSKLIFPKDTGHNKEKEEKLPRGVLLAMRVQRWSTNPPQ